MAHTITATNVGGVISPIAIDGYNPSRDSRNRIHDLLDGSIGVSYISPRPRSGTLQLVFRNENDAHAAFYLHGEETSFNLFSDAIPSMAMKYVLDGTLTIDFEARTGMWRVTVGYQELSA